MKKVSTVAAKQTMNFPQPKLTISLDLGDRSSWYCLLDEVGDSDRPSHGRRLHQLLRHYIGLLTKTTADSRILAD